MKRVLGRKQSISNDLWIEALANIEELVSEEELKEAVATVIKDIQGTTNEKKIAYAWSGGKDSLVLANICKQIDIRDCVFGHNELEYPAFFTWCLEHIPENCDVINTGQNIEWLVKHPNMLFPANSALVSRWYDIVQKTAIKQYCRKHKLDMILVGHRKADGNYVGQNNICSNNAGVTRYSPLADWPHEMLLAYIHYNHIPMPPIYGWKDGYKCGTHSWPSRMGMKSVEAGWRDVYEIDPSIVLGVADKIDSAAQFLKGVSV